MREDDLEYRRMPPVWRRIMILLAVIAAVPVVMWSITAFVRAYVAPPKVPTFRGIAAATPTDTTGAIAPAGATALRLPPPISETPTITIAPKSDGAVAGRPAAPIMEARRTATDARPSVEMNAKPVDGAPAEPLSTEANPATLAQRPDAAAPPAEDIPAGEPIKGRVPLPPHRPRIASTAPTHGAIPVPRARPDAAEPATPAPADGNLSQRDYMN